MFDKPGPAISANFGDLTNFPTPIIIADVNWLKQNIGIPLTRFLQPLVSNPGTPAGRLTARTHVPRHFFCHIFLVSSPKTNQDMDFFRFLSFFWVFFIFFFFFWVFFWIFFLHNYYSSLYINRSLSKLAGFVAVVALKIHSCQSDTSGNADVPVFTDQNHFRSWPDLDLVSDHVFEGEEYNRNTMRKP